MTQTSLFDYLIVDNFAGGGGASCGIELATGRPVNIAINHDPDAIAMHKANHPYTEHYQESVWDINPIEICKGQPVGLAWFSPDCKHFSKAKGGKPVDKNIRGLAWIVLKWAGTVRPRVIILENVEEFQTWGPVRKGKPVKSKQGETFEKWKSQLSALGYTIEQRELKACDYGAPTIRKRFFLIARCDGEPIMWPEPTHGPADSPEVKSGKRKPYRTAADCIDFTIPCKSIFDRKKPLAVNTQRRIARGLDKFVIKESKPFILPIGYGERSGQKPRVHDIEKPLPTIVSSCKQYLCLPYLSSIKFNNEPTAITNPLQTITAVNSHSLITPALIQYHSETTKAEVRGQSLDKPVMTVDSSPRYGLFIPYLSKYFGGVIGADIQSPMPTVTAIDHNALAMPFLTKYYSGKDQSFSCNSPLHTITAKDRISSCHAYLTILRNNMECRSINDPLNTVTTSGAHFAYTKVYVKKYKQGCNLYNWSKVRELLNTYTDWNLADNEILIFNINGTEQFIYDIGLRMLQPKELYKAQGFPDDYIIETDCNGKSYPKSKQVARCGNAVPPPFAKALVTANCQFLCVKHCNNMAEFNSVAAG